MEKIAKKLILLLPAITGLLSADGSCAASCPYGLVNDPYPGQCPRYTDLNGDGFCDFSQTSTSMATDTAADEPHQGDATNHTIGDADADGVDYHIKNIFQVVKVHFYTLFLF